MTEERLALIRAAQKGDPEALERIAESDLPLVRYIALRFAGRGDEPEDLIQTGAVGLIKAVFGYDPGFGTEFSTYAFSMITGEIRRHLRDGSLIRVSRRVSAIAAQIARIRDEISKSGGELPSAKELAEMLHAEPFETEEALSLLIPRASLDAIPDSGASLMELLPDETEAQEKCESRLLARQLAEALPERERELISLRYFSGLTQSAAAKRMDISQPQASRLEKKALKMMRDICG